MKFLKDFIDLLPGLIYVLVVVALVVLTLWFANWFFLRRQTQWGETKRFSRRIVVMLLTVFGVLVIILALPVNEPTRNQLIGLFGLLLTATIALASSTFAGNAMAGLMLRMVRSFKVGDFICIGEEFGRVTDRGLFHTEIQTEDRTLTTLPNLYLITNPVTVTRASGTIVSAQVSLGYDNLHTDVETLLVEAAEKAKLGEPFVQIVDLGDFAVTYRVAGFLPEVQQILTARSHLRAMMLSTLHAGGIEIMSPAFMNQRRIDPNVPIKPSGYRTRLVDQKEMEDQIPEELIFDKAEKAEKLDQIKARYANLKESVEDLEKQMKKADKETKKHLKKKIEDIKADTEILSKVIKRAEKKVDDPPL